MRYFIMGTSSNVVSGTWELSLFKTNVIIIILSSFSF